MGRRIYMVPMNSVAVGTAVQDIFALKTVAGAGCQLHHIQLSAGGVSVASEINMRLKRGSATFAFGTAGGGGTAPTPVAVDINDTLASNTTAHVNDSGSQSTAGAFTNLGFFQWNQLLPFDYMPGPEDEDRETVSGSGVLGLVLDLPATVGTSFLTSGFLKFRDIP